MGQSASSYSRNVDSSLSLAVFALAICDMNVRESVTSWANSLVLLTVSARAESHQDDEGVEAHSWSLYRAPSLARACSWYLRSSSSAIHVSWPIRRLSSQH
jgi:hypothetical protein